MRKRLKRNKRDKNKKTYKNVSTSMAHSPLRIELAGAAGKTE